MPGYMGGKPQTFVSVDINGNPVSPGVATIADGANVTQGTTTDAAYTSGAGTIVSILKGVFGKIEAVRALLAGSIAVTSADGANTGQGSTSVAAYSDATGAASGTLIGLLKGLFVKLAGTLSVGGKLAFVSYEFTRPADTTAYAQKDVISNSTSAPVIMSWAGAARVSGGSGYITKARLVTDQKTNVATYRLWLYRSTPTPINDNSPYLLLYADNAIRCGYIDFAALTTEDATNSTAAASTNIADKVPYDCAVTTLFGILEVTLTGGFTPATGQKYWCELTFDQN